LLLVGNPSWSFGYREVIKALRDRFRCIAVDYPGFGLSQASPGYDFLPSSHSQVVEALVDRLALDGVTVMGYDWGGPIGLGWAGRRPEKVRALIIGNTWAWPADTGAMKLFSALLGGPLSGLLIGRLNMFVNVFLQGGVKRRKLSAAEIAAYRGPFPRGRRKPMQVFPRAITGEKRWLAEVEAGLAKLRDKPALILWADSDPAFKDRERRRFESLFPNHRTVPLKKVGHNLEEDAPDDVVAAIRDWWPKEVEAGPA
jgi:haloalkane dehalogenase